MRPDTHLVRAQVLSGRPPQDSWTVLVAFCGASTVASNGRASESVSTVGRGRGVGGCSSQGEAHLQVIFRRVSLSSI